jgi:hypothetical protein
MDEDSAGEIILYRAVSAEELAHIEQFNDYGFSPHGGGKYFGFTLEGVLHFARSDFNRERQMTITRTSIPSSFVERGFIFNDVGGAGRSIHFSDETLLEIYEAMEEIEILELP